eukprot:TRINITY_DN23692_c0_g1_i1.p1 TRINITY_DN23692_c0_g1~~TRINITY_DN23692_c0_g1_i1.p1  ORF type:complete len:192 (-),score=18.04 TRINITY_DN23692_c0_g1_i1:33-608(-)
MAHTTFPKDLPVPTDDGACNHLVGSTIPSSLSLPTTDSDQVSLSQCPGLTIVFCYPRTGAPNEIVPESWNAIPGARGCTPQACSFRDTIDELKKLGVSRVFGVSTQSSDYQREVKERLHLPYELLSDELLEFVNALKLPTFEWEGKKVIKRLAIAIEDGKISKCWYPIFPPNSNAADVSDWLKQRRGESHI